MNQFWTLWDYSSLISSNRGFLTLCHPSIWPQERPILNCCKDCTMVVTNSVWNILVLDNGWDVVDGKTFFTVCWSSSPEERVLHNVNSLTSNQKLFPLVPESLMRLWYCYKKILLA